MPYGNYTWAKNSAVYKFSKWTSYGPGPFISRGNRVDLEKKRSTADRTRERRKAKRRGERNKKRGNGDGEGEGQRGTPEKDSREGIGSDRHDNC